MSARPVALSIAGSDSGGGAGLQMDLRVLSAQGCWATSVVTCVTSQNLSGVTAVSPLPAEHVRSQIEAVLDGFTVRAIKTGMLFSLEIVDTVAEVLERFPALPVVVDPVMVATSGAPLLEDGAVRAYRERLARRATVLTPNLDEAAVLLGRKVRTRQEMEGAARELADDLGCAVFLKGGHLEGDPVDVLVHRGRAHSWAGTRVPVVNTHGSGCALSAAVAAGLAQGLDLVPACESAHRFLAAALRAPVRLESGVALLGVG